MDPASLFTDHWLYLLLLRSSVLPVHDAVQTEHLIRCQPSAYQTALMTMIKESLSNAVTAQGLKGVNNSMMELHVICNHPLIRCSSLLSS